MYEVNVGLIGYGFSGRTFHAPVIQDVPGLRLASVVERSGQASRERPMKEPGALSAWIPVDFVDENNGCMMVCSGIA